MKRSAFFLFLWFLLFGSASVCYGEKKLVAVRTATPPHLDGSGDEPAWQHAPVLKTFDRVAGLQLEIQSV
jgi:hypothetical protein